MHDRRVGGDVKLFGNQGALYMNAMTWYDHETESIWSQPWGTAIAGPLKGTRLEMLPVSLEPWASWKSGHPDTLVADVNGRFMYAGEAPRSNFVIGVVLGEDVKAYPFSAAAAEQVINDVVGVTPIVVLVDAESRAVRAYVRVAGGSTLTFRIAGGALRDTETGSLWNGLNGLAMSGLLKGAGLKAVPYVSAFPDNWLDFFPDSEVYGGS